MEVDIYIFTLAHLCTPVRVSRGLLPSTSPHPSCKAFGSSTPLFCLVYSQRCRSYSPPRSRSGIAHPSSSWCREVREAAASRAWRGHPTDSRTCCQEKDSDVRGVAMTNLKLIRYCHSFSRTGVFSSTTTSDLLLVDHFFPPPHSWIVTAAAASHSPTTTLSKSAAIYCTALSYLVTMDWIFCHIFQLKKKPKSLYCARIDYVLLSSPFMSFSSCAVCWHFPVRNGFFTAEGKSQCMLNIESVFRISQVHVWPTTGCWMNAWVQGTYIINALHTVDCCIMTLLMHKGSDLCSEMLTFLSVISLCAQYSTRIEF